MAQIKQRNKLKASEVTKINNRYFTKLEEFNKKTPEELIELSKTKMSYTDKRALVQAYSDKRPKYRAIPITTNKDGDDSE